MTNRTTITPQLMDFKAAFFAGLIAGAIFLLVLLITYPLATGGTPWTVFRFIAAIVLGEEVLPPPVSFNAAAVIVGTLLHFALSIFYTFIIAFVLHRWGLIVGIVGGALLGLALYLINFFTFTIFFEWFYVARAWPFSIVHILFGAVAGGVYELLEDESYEDAEFVIS